MAKHGLAMDNLLSAEVITASGEIVRASKDENADLFWGFQGGGGNFGAVSWSGVTSSPSSREGYEWTDRLPFSTGSRRTEFFREITSTGLPDDLAIFGALLHAPDGAKIAVMIACHCGPLGEAEAALQPIKKFGTPVVDTIGPTTYEATNSMLDAGFPRGALNYWKSNFMMELSDQAIDTLIAQFAACPSPMSGLLLEHIHGAATRVGVNETAFPTGARAIIFSSSPSGSTRVTTRGILRGRGSRTTLCGPV